MVMVLDSGSRFLRAIQNLDFRFRILDLKADVSATGAAFDILNPQSKF